MTVRDPDDSSPSRSDQAGQVGVGEPLTATDRRWLQAAAELEPARSLARAEDRAKQLVGTVSVVGVLLGGLGLVAATRLEAVPVARWLAIATVTLASAGVVLALWTLVLREHTVRPNDLEAVQRWYAAQFRRARLVRAAGLLLLGGVLLAGLTGLVILVAHPDDRPVVELVVSGSGTAQTAHATVRWSGLPSTQVVIVTLTGMTGTTRQVLAQGVANAEHGGRATVTLDTTKLRGASRLVVSVVAGTRSCVTTLTLNPLGAGRPSAALTCQHA
jgi:hypothetical protein